MGKTISPPLAKENDIQNGIWSSLSSAHIFCVPNVYFYPDWESDLISVTNSGRVWEFEIKLSKSDYKRDFEKRRHEIMDHNPYRGAYQFYYVIYGFDLSLDELPPYAGLMVASYWRKYNIFYPSVKKSSPRRSKTKKITDKQKLDLSRKLMFRYWDNRITRSVNQA